MARNAFSHVLLFCLILSSSAFRMRHSRIISQVISPLMRLRGGDSSELAPNVQMFPALTEEEIMNKLNTIPVFQITDKDGNALILKEHDGKVVSWVFLQLELAQQLVSNFMNQSNTSLFIHDIELGKIWRSIGVAGNTTYFPTNGTMNNDQNRSESKVEIRVLANSNDLSYAQNITITSLNHSESNHLSIVQKESISKKVAFLTKKYNVVPLFSMSGMQIPLNSTIGNSSTLSFMRPWFLSISNCLDSFKSASRKHDMIEGEGEGKGIDNEEAKKIQAEKEKLLMENTLHIATLEELIDVMGKPSPVDFKNIIFIPSSLVKYL